MYFTQIFVHDLAAIELQSSKVQELLSQFCFHKMRRMKRAIFKI